MDENVKECIAILLIICNGINLMMNFPILVQSQGRFDMNLFGNLSTNHSWWPILLVIYNLPPGLYLKQKYMMLFMKIPNSRQ